jgi:hypothetical protein
MDKSINEGGMRHHQQQSLYISRLAIIFLATNIIVVGWEKITEINDCLSSSTTNITRPLLNLNKTCTPFD